MNIGQLLSLPELRNDLERVDAALRQSVTADDPFLSEVATHLIAAGGKRLRPSMAIASALVAGEGPVPEGAIQGAVVVELIHLGSLYHDDVLDDAKSRRSVPSVNAQYGNFMAIVAGDFLLARASGTAAKLGPEATLLCADTMARLCEGQAWEQRFSYSLERTIDSYNSCISGKTASLIAASCQLGAMAVDLDQDQVQALSEFGHSFGMAFQIRDDVLDIVGTDEQLGKPAGNDMVEGVYTLPVLCALNNPEAAKELNGLLNGPIGTPERDKAKEIVRQSGGVEAAINIGLDWCKQAESALTRVTRSPMRDHLFEISGTLFENLG